MRGRIRRKRGSVAAPRARELPATPIDQEPLGGGLMRRIAAGTKGVAPGAFSVLEEVFAPTHHKAREEIEEQRRVGRPAPSPSDPPRIEPAPGAGDDPATRFHGRIVFRELPGTPSGPQAPQTPTG